MTAKACCYCVHFLPWKGWITAPIAQHPREGDYPEMVCKRGHVRRLPDTCKDFFNRDDLAKTIIEDTQTRFPELWEMAKAYLTVKYLDELVKRIIATYEKKETPWLNHPYLPGKGLATVMINAYLRWRKQCPASEGIVNLLYKKEGQWNTKTRPT